MKVLITHFFSKKNKGDAAINSVLLTQLKAKYPSADITLSSSDAFVPGETFEGAPFVSSILYEALYVSTNPLVRVLRTIFVLAASLLWVLTNKRSYVPSRLRGFLGELSEADLVAPTGGSYLMSHGSMKSNVVLLLQLWPIYLAQMLGKRVIMQTQSIGPFKNTLTRSFTRYVLNAVESIDVRESITLHILKDMGIYKPAIKLTQDLAFQFSSPHKKEMGRFLKNMGIEDTNIKVGITVRRCYDDMRQSTYEESIAGFADYIVDKYDAQIIFAAQSTSTLHNDDDRVVGRKIVQRMKKQKSVALLENEFDHYRIKSLFENLDYLISTRMHAAIFAITAHVPTIAIAYEHKTTGIMKSIGLSHLSLELSDINEDRLVNKFNSLYETH